MTKGNELYYYQYKKFKKILQLLFTRENLKCLLFINQLLILIKLTNQITKNYKQSIQI